MKNLRILFLFAAIVGASFSTSCKKEEPLPDPPTKKEMLSKTWKIQEYYYNGQLDNNPIYGFARITFRLDGTYTLSIPGDVENGVWQFNADESSIILNIGTEDEYSQELLALTEISCRIKQVEDEDTYELLLVPAE